MGNRIKIGFPRMRAEAGERRDFLPDFIARLEKVGSEVSLEYGYGSGMGFTEEDYLRLAPELHFTSHEETYQQDIVLLVRCPNNEDLRRLTPGACLITMVHYPTRDERVEFLRSLGIEAISLDSIKDDSGRRLVENLRSVAWNGVNAAFDTLRKIYPAPGFESPDRGPVRVTLMGAGAVGGHVVDAAVRYGNREVWQSFAQKEIPGVQVTVVDYDTTLHFHLMRPLLETTDILIDATQRPDPSQPVIPNEWIAYLPMYSVILDLSVDPYHCGEDPVMVKGVEGIPQGNLDQYVFAPDDPAFDLVPECIPTAQRRYSVSCYSWPGVQPKECMRIYGHQLRPLMRTLIEKGGPHNIDPQGKYFERALSRAMLSRWLGNNNHI